MTRIPMAVIVVKLKLRDRRLSRCFRNRIAEKQSLFTVWFFDIASPAVEQRVWRFPLRNRLPRPRSSDLFFTQD
jgi:hypothetical protein